MKDQDLDKMFSDSLKDQEATPPASVWQGIESKLDETKVIPMKPKLNWQVWAIAACLLIALGIGLNMPDRQLNNETDQPQVASNEVNQVEKLPNTDQQKLDLPSTTINQPVEKVISQSKESVLAESNNPTAESTIAIEKTIAKTDKAKQDRLADSGNRLALSETKKSFEKISPAGEMEVINAIELNEIDKNKVELSAIEVAPIQPLVNIIENEDVMYAEVKQQPKKKQTIFTNILNNIAENINPSNKTVKFSSDDEGTIKVDLFNSIAKTRR
jgi:hypothetical protein